jgi:A/G-specific adenine glycosylase
LSAPAVPPVPGIVPATSQAGSVEHPLHGPVLGWYAVHARDLPWRHPDCPPWQVLISEVMLQQTPVARVLPVWQEWVARWPAPADLADEPAGEAIRAWGRLGYPRRALRLHEAARVIVEEYAGRVPDDHVLLLRLPGVGGYTAAAVASFAFGRRHAVVDTNVRRVFARAVTGAAQAAPALTSAESRLATSLLPADPSRVATWNVAVMELGALVCRARGPRCGDCPVAGRCAWQLAGAPASTTPSRPSQAWHGTDRQVRGALLAALRATDGALNGADLLDGVTGDSEQRRRCLEGLLADGLVEAVRDAVGTAFRLPT